MTPKLTIIVPVYNRADRLPQTLSTIAAAQQVPLALILLDNGSSDDSWAICQRFAAEHASETFEITVLKEPQKGASRARNNGLSNCQTEWVYFFDSDDDMSGDFCKKIVGELTEKGEQLDVLAFPVRQVVNGKMTVRAYQQNARPEVHILNSMLSTVSVVYRTEWLKAQGGWNETLTTWDDWELGTRVLMAGPRMKWVTESAFHRLYVHDDSQTGDSFTTTYRKTLVAMEAVKDDAEKATLTAEERQRVMLAMYFRARIMAGKLAHEGCTEGKAAYREMAERCVGPCWWQKMWGWLLERYTALGGRGAWRAALALC